ncbi:hypothetical protein DFH07DRAFT_1055845, partial [Mycena maculata]
MHWTSIIYVNQAEYGRGSGRTRSDAREAAAGRSLVLIAQKDRHRATYPGRSRETGTRTNPPNPPMARQSPTTSLRLPILQKQTHLSTIQSTRRETGTDPLITPMARRSIPEDPNPSEADTLADDTVDSNRPSKPTDGTAEPDDIPQDPNPSEADTLADDTVDSERDRDESSNPTDGTVEPNDIPQDPDPSEAGTLAGDTVDSDESSNPTDGGKDDRADDMQNITLNVKDINKKDIFVSLPMERCRVWETFRNRLLEQEVQPLQYIERDEFVLVVVADRFETSGWQGVEDRKNWISQEDWADWVSPFCSATVPTLLPPVAIRLIRPGDGPCCDQPTEDTNSLKCANCKTQFVNLPVPNDSDIESSTPTLTATSRLLNASTSNPVITTVLKSTLTTLPKFTAENSVMRRRRQHFEREEHVYPPVRVASPEPDPEDNERRSAGRLLRLQPRSVIDWLSAPYTFMIAPPFLCPEEVAWDTQGQRLDNRLNAFQSWIWGANAALFAFAAALLALSDVTTIPQSFVMLSAIFAFFGFIYTVFLAFHVGDSKEEFSRWFHEHPNLRHTSGSFWNLTIMMSLPLTWMARAILSLCLG